MLTVSSPAPILESMPFFAQAERMKGLARRAAMLQLLNSETVAFRDASGGLVAIGGFYPLPDEDGCEAAEVWFACTPDLARGLVGFVRLARLTCARMADHGPVKLRALVRIGHEPGRRLAVLCGFHLAAVDGGYEQWEWSGGHDEIRSADLHAEPDGRATGADAAIGSARKGAGSPAGAADAARE